MPQLKIECAGAAVGNWITTFTPSDIYGTSVPTDALIYPSPLVSCSRFKTPAGGYFDSPVPVFAWQKPALDFLDTKQINSIKLHFYVAASATFARFTAHVSVCHPNFPFRPGMTSGYRDIFNNYGGRIANDYAFYNDVKTFGPCWNVIAIDSLATLKNAVQNGIRIMGTNTVPVPLSLGIYTAGTAFAPYILVDYLDENTPATVNGISPNTVIVDSGGECDFSWSYKQVVNHPQSHFQLQYSPAATEGWQNLTAKEAGSAPHYLVPADTISPGDNLWRVKVWHLNGQIESAFSKPLPFLAKGAPKPPLITTLDTTPQPELVWQSKEGQGFQVLVQRLDASNNEETDTDHKERLIYQSTAIYSMENRFKFPYPLADGCYRFALRVVSVQGIWSEWSATEVVTKNLPGAEIRLEEAPSTANSICLRWEDEGNFDCYYILRNGLPVKKTTDRQFIDYRACGDNSYCVRGMKGSYFTNSNSLKATTKVKYSVLLPIEQLGQREWLTLAARRGGRPEHRSNMKAAVKMVQYENKRQPVAYRGGQSSEQHHFSFTLKNPDEYARLSDMAGSIVLYKDWTGLVLVGCLSDIATTTDLDYDVRFCIERTQYSEEIPYV